MLNEIEYEKCLKCRKEYPAEGFVDGLCGSCLMEKHYCDECVHCELATFDDPDEALSLSTCLANPKDKSALARLSKKWDKEPVSFCFCCNVDRADQCENFKFHAGA